MLINGKQLKDASVADVKLIEAYIKASGARAFTGSQSMGGFKITNAADGVADSDYATFGQVKAFARGLTGLKNPVRVATTGALPTNTRSSNTLTASVNGAFPAQDGVTLVVNDRILVKDEVTGANNGFYYVVDLGSGSTPWVLTRTTDADASAEVFAGVTVWVNEGTTNGDCGFALTTNDPITLNTTALTFIKYTGLGQITAGNGLTQTGNVLDVGAGLGIQVNANDVSINLNTNAGLVKNLGTGSNELGIALDANPGLQIISNLLSIKVTDTSIIKSAAGIRSAVPTKLDKAKAIVTNLTGDNTNTTLSISATPAAGSYVRVKANGHSQTLGDGVKTADCYFSADAGVTARGISAIQSGDIFYWNGVIAGFDLLATDADKVSFDYVV